MNTLLAQYLFNKEVLYKNADLLIEPQVQGLIIEKKQEAPQVSIPISAPVEEKVIEKPVLQIPPVSSVHLVLKHKVLIITEVISADEKTLLGKILEAVGLSLDQVDLIEIQKIQHLDYQSFISQKVTTKFISFGVGFGKLNWDLLLVPYQVRNVSGVDFLLANELYNIAADTNLKKNLWGALQKMFSK